MYHLYTRSNAYTSSLECAVCSRCCLVLSCFWLSVTYYKILNFYQVCNGSCARHSFWVADTAIVNAVRSWQKTVCASVIMITNRAESVYPKEAEPDLVICLFLHTSIYYCFQRTACLSLQHLLFCIGITYISHSPLFCPSHAACRICTPA